jgi:F-type H+-transporting ATPase subunit epsilon
MAMTMHCDIVSAEEDIFSGRVTSLTVTGTLGELGILPGHAPLLTGIRPGPVKLKFDNGEERVFFASGGFLEVQPSVVTVLADTAVRAEDIDEASAAEAQAAARRALEDRNAGVEFSLAAAQLAEAMARQRTLDELRKRSR